MSRLALTPRQLFLTMSAGLVALLTALFVSVIHSTPTNAVTGADWNPGYIISDSVFYNEDSMAPSAIQSFLESKVPSCDTNGAGRATEYGRGDLTRAQYAATRGWHGPPYVCMRDYKQNTPQMEASSTYCNAIPAGSNRSAAQIIYDISKACHINPQVLIVLLQKEQSLILDIWPLNGQYEDATGFACPDTAPCDPAYAVQD